MHKTYVHVCVWACATSRYARSAVECGENPNKLQECAEGAEQNSQTMLYIKHFIHIHIHIYI